MNKEQAYEAMLRGHRVANEYYTPDEYLFINQVGLIEAEDGCIFGTKFDEAWAKYQDPENKYEWHIVSTPFNRMFNEADPYLIINPYNHMDAYDDMKNFGKSRKEREAILIPVKPKDPIGRNDLCSCNSGKKSKKCCKKYTE